MAEVGTQRSSLAGLYPGEAGSLGGLAGPQACFSRNQHALALLRGEVHPKPQGQACSTWRHVLLRRIRGLGHDTCLCGDGGQGGRSGSHWQSCEPGSSSAVGTTYVSYGDPGAVPAHDSPEIQGSVAPPAIGRYPRCSDDASFYCWQDNVWPHEGWLGALRCFPERTMWTFTGGMQGQTSLCGCLAQWESMWWQPSWSRLPRSQSP